MEQERKKKNSTELQKPNIDAEVYNNNKNCHWIYTYTLHAYKQNQNSPIKIEYSRLTWQTKGTKNYIYHNKTN